MSVKNKIRDYLDKHVLFGIPVNDTDSLFQSNLMDSTSAVELVIWLEEAFDITIDDDELEPETIETINALTSLVEQKIS